MALDCSGKVVLFAGFLGALAFCVGFRSLSGTFWVTGTSFYHSGLWSGCGGIYQLFESCSYQYVYNGAGIAKMLMNSYFLLKVRIFSIISVLCSVGVVITSFMAFRVFKLYYFLLFISFFGGLSGIAAGAFYSNDILFSVFVISYDTYLMIFCGCLQLLAAVVASYPYIRENMGRYIFK